MRRKFKNAIRDSFSFPETANKDDFFRQVEGNSVREKKHRRYMPMMLGFVAGAAAMALCIGVWENMKNSPIPSEYNYSVGDSIIVTSTPDESETVTTEQYGTETTIATDFSSVISQTTTSAVTDKGEISAEVTEITSSVLTQGTSAVTVTKPIVTTTSVAYVSTAPVTTITTTTSTDENDERSIYMKKLTAFTSAITILAVSGSLNAYAEYQPPEITADVQAVIEYIEQNDPDLDLNCDGEINARDVYTAFLYALNYTSALSDDIMAKCSASEFSNVKGFKSFARYYLLTYGINQEEFVRSYYKINGEMSGKGNEDSFVHWLKRTADEYDLGYQALCEKVNSGEISLDFNADGKTNILDAYDYYYYDYYQTQNAYQSIISGNSDYPLSTWLNCIYFDSIKPDGVIASTNSSDVNGDYYVVVKYFLYNSQITEDMFENDMYIAHYNNFQAAANFKATLKTMATTEGVVPPDENEINDELFWQYYDACEAEFNNGTRPLPDVDFNGVIDYEDYFVSNIFFGDHLENVSCEDSILPADIWNNLNENCDFSGNGISGDVYDTSIIQIYVLKYAEEEPEDFDEAYQEYIKEFAEAKDSAISASVYSDNLMYSTQCKMLSDREQTRSDTDPSLYGDADLDGKVTMADVVKVTIYASNPEKNPLTEEALNNCDVYQRGDGVGISDALSIQKKIAQVIDTLPEV